MKKILAVVFASLMLVSGMAFAVPTVQQIESAIQQGNWSKADAGLNEVLQAHPNNAHAHYLYGQVLDREGRSADGLAQLQQAKTLDPQLRFAGTPDRFAQVQARISQNAQRTGGGNGLSTGLTTGRSSNSLAQGNGSGFNSSMQGAAMAPRAPAQHGPGMGLWIGLAIVVIGIALVLRWTLRRARNQGDSRADDERRTQLKRATDMLNAVRSLKLDVKLSTAPGHELLEKEVEGAEEQLRGLVETLSGSKNPVPPYQLDELEQKLGSLRARADGKPDPYAAAVNPAAADGQSPYAREAERFGTQPPPQAPYPYPQQQQPPVVIQQGGGGFGGGMGGLLTGVLLGEALNHGRDRVIERDVYVDDEGRRRGGDADQGGGVDFGVGSNDWSDGGGGVDMGSNDSGGGWDDNNT